MTEHELTEMFKDRDDEFWGVHQPYGPLGPTEFESGGSWAFCTSWARAVQAKLGAHRVRVFGFWADDMVEATALADNFIEGHDFALVDSRFIVDPWIHEVMGISERIVFDLDTEEGRRASVPFHGHPHKWTPVGLPVIERAFMHGMELGRDHEGYWLRGVSNFDETFRTIWEAAEAYLEYKENTR